MTAKDIAFANTILRGVVGSTALGTALPGTDDRDEMGVFVEPPENVCGLRSIDHVIQRDQPEGARSQPGDLDLTFYSLRRYCHLAAQGNPSVLILMWIPEHMVKTPIGERLLSIREHFYSRSAGKRFLGYLVSQKRALKGERTKKVSRPEVVAKYGYDTKFAMHALRLGYEGIEYMRTRQITLPTPEPMRETLMAIRMGEMSLAEALALIERTETELEQLVNGCHAEPGFNAINSFLVEAHHQFWSTADAIEAGEHMKHAYPVNAHTHKKTYHM